jgi:hypothetical protein
MAKRVSPSRQSRIKTDGQAAMEDRQKKISTAMCIGGLACSSCQKQKKLFLLLLLSIFFF